MTHRSPPRQSGAATRWRARWRFRPGAAPASSCGWYAGRWRRRSAPRSPTPSSTRWRRPRRATFIFATPLIQRDLGTTLQDIEYEALATLIATEGDLEAEYQRFVDRWLREGGATWQEQATVIYQRERGL